VGSVRVVGANCDFRASDSWLVRCAEEHGEVCNGRSEPVAGLMVIDCVERRMVFLPEMAEYATLSYVWAKATPVATEHEHDEREDTDDGLMGMGNLPAQLPAVVRDAIHVAIQCGLTYLWVDRYCIPQDEGGAGEKQRQIQLMGQIYANSSLTIIDASPSRSDGGAAGLAGVSAPRIPQPHVQGVGGGYRLVSCLPPTGLEIAQSTWATRGWTYQEGQLARRRLVFTPHQTYFQCQRAHGCESLAMTFNSLGGDMRLPLAAFDPYFARRGLGATTGVLEPGGVKPLIRDLTTYMARSLTFQSDRLNAFLAILRDHQTAQGGVVTGHFIGVPLLAPRSFVVGSRSAGRKVPPRASDPSTRTKQLLAGLSWYLDGARTEGQWPTRYSCFPSWSWIAWRWPGSGRFRLDFGGVREISEMPTDTLSSWVGVSTKFRDGEVVPWETSEGRIEEKSVAGVAIDSLVFDAWTFDIGVERLPAAVGGDYEYSAAVTDNVVLRDYELKGLIIGYRSDYRGKITTLIALECGQPLGDRDGHWYRVGHGQVYLPLRDKKDAIRYRGKGKATVAARAIPWQRWKRGRVKLKRQVIELY